jgi:hypothetical protein
MTEVPTLDQLPGLDRPVDIDPSTVAGFRTDGHAVVRGLSTPEEMAAYRPVITEAALGDSRETRPIESRDTYAKAFLQIPNLWRRHAGVKRFVFGARFAKAAADLLGVGGVRLYHDQALFKEPGGGRTPWHQDQFYWPLDTDRTVTMWMPLVDVPPEVGSMTFVSGSQRLGYLGDFDISDRSDATFDEMIRSRHLCLHTHGAMAAGDATFHAGWVLHSAPPNPSGGLRAVMTVIWYADGARITEPANPYQDFDRRKWLSDLPPGSVADGEKNPRLWPLTEIEKKRGPDGI